jgi:hypothetical protein
MEVDLFSFNQLAVSTTGSLLVQITNKKGFYASQNGTVYKLSVLTQW